MTTSLRETAMTAQRLGDAHEALGKLRPSPYEDDPHRWLKFLEFSASVYREVAEVDRGHHHEALYWAKREQDRANKIKETAKAKGAAQAWNYDQAGGSLVGQ